MQQVFYGDRIKLCLKIGIAGIICILIGNLFHLERNVLVAKSIDDLLDCIIQINQSVNLINSNKQNNLSALTPIGEKL